MPAAVISHDQKDRIQKLYYNRKLSVPVIARTLGVSANAVYSFMQRNDLPRRTLVEENKLRFSRKPPSFKVKTRLSLSELRLKIAGSMLYWAEGFQSDSASIVDFANSKPEMMLLFVKFLRKICGIEEAKLRAYLYCYANQNVDELIKFWSKLLEIPKNGFTKPYIRRDFRPDKVRKMKYGLLHVRYGDKKLLNIIRTWIKEYGTSLTKTTI